jgi:hypothetical protein
MLQSENYVLRRQSLKLLSEFLLDRENFPIMMRYIQARHHTGGVWVGWVGCCWTARTSPS